MSDVKEECNKIFKQLDEEKSGSSQQLVSVSVSSLQVDVAMFGLSLMCSSIVHSSKDGLQI